MNNIVWSVLFNSVRIKENIATREEAKCWVENTDLIDAFSKFYSY